MNLLETFTPDLTDPHSVEANRRGELTPDQQARLANPLSALGGQNIGFMGLNLLRQAAHLQQDLHTPHIESAVGQLALEKQGYVADISDRRLTLPPNRGRLQPGVTYQFYYLPESGAVLSAEEIQSPGVAALREQLTGLLAQAHRYPVSVLEINRQGKLSNVQTSGLIKVILQGLLLAALAIVIGGLFAITFLTTPKIVLVVRLVGVGISGLAGLFALGGLGQALRAALDLLSNRVECVEGVVQKKVEVSRSRSSRGHRQSTRRFYYVIDARRFQVGECAYHALIEDLPYRLYYTPRSQLLVGVEPLAGPTSQRSGPWAV